MTLLVIPRASQDNLQRRLHSTGRANRGRTGFSYLSERAISACPAEKCPFGTHCRRMDRLSLCLGIHHGNSFLTLFMVWPFPTG
jgi:hypothetical protein